MEVGERVPTAHSYVYSASSIRAFDVSIMLILHFLSDNAILCAIFESGSDACCISLRLTCPFSCLVIFVEN